MYGFWDMECDRQSFLWFWDIFYPFTTPLTTRKIKILKKYKKHLKIFSFYTCLPQMKIIIYGSWDTKHKTWFFVIFSYSCHFTLLSTPKIKILKKLKKHQKISSFYKSVLKTMIICYTVPAICDGRNFYFSFWAIFCPFIREGLKVALAFYGG